jgi:hypothetical protein
MHLARLTLATILKRKVWAVWLVLLVALTAVLPFTTPWEQDPTLIEPARAQAVWVGLWIAALTWGLFQGAGFGESLSKHGLGEYFSSQGVSRLSQLGQIFAACFASILPFVAVAVAVCLVWAMPGDKLEARAWTFTLIQYGFLFTLVFASLLLLAIALGTRLGSAVAYLVTLGLALYGLYGVGFMDLLFEARKDAVMETLWTLSPHYHLGDLTTRLIFKTGHLPVETFAKVAAYLGLLALLHGLVSYASFRPRTR